MTQKTEFYNTFDNGIDLSPEIQKEIDNGWLVKFVISAPFESYHGGDLYKPQTAVTIIYEKLEVSEVETTPKQKPIQPPSKPSKPMEIRKL